MFEKLKRFHQKTMEEYQKGLDQEMEDWKKRVMEIHEKSGFLFYADELDPDYHKGVCIIRGDLVKNDYLGLRQVQILNGEGEELATALVRTHPSGKEERSSGFVKKKRNEFEVQLLTMQGGAVEELSKEEYNRRLIYLIREISLIVENK